MTEQWKGIAGYEGLYQVSSYGRVYSLISRRMLTQSDSPYRSVSLCRGGTRKRARVHSLVLEAFVGPPEGREACHNDGNPLNNKVSNLRWDTSKNNCADRMTHGTAPVGENNPRAKLTEADVRDVKRRLREGELHKDIAQCYGVGRRTITEINLGNNWSHVK